MTLLRLGFAAMLMVVLTTSALVPSGGGAAAASGVELTENFMNDPGNIAAGKKIFEKQCARCHGRKAYPGKAPKLNQKKYRAEFVYKRITKGFRGMPSWKRRYNETQRKSVTAYVMSKDFTN